MGSMKTGIVLVTYNRREKLEKALDCYENQSFRPSYVLVVNNHSTDGTEKVLKEWQKKPADYLKEVITLKKNTGGAGGFYTGMERALELEADWIWVADDDAYPRADALMKLNDYYESLSYEKQKEIVVLCSAVYNDGRIHVGHRNHLKMTKFKCVIYTSAVEEYKKKAFQLDVMSYVGACMRKNALVNAGLDEKDYFIYCDDREHSLRLRKEGRIICVPESIVDHDSPPFDPNAVSWGKYYLKRNDLLMIRKHFPVRYFVLRYIRRYFYDASVFSKSPKELRKILRAAYWDALWNKKGMHAVYRPGWKAGSRE